jgi:hypothetical protein
MAEHALVAQVRDAALAARAAEDAIAQRLNDVTISQGEHRRLMPVFLLLSAARGNLEAAVNYHVTAFERGRG